MNKSKVFKNKKHSQKGKKDQKAVDHPVRLKCPFCQALQKSKQSLGGHISKAHPGKSFNSRTTERNKKCALADNQQPKVPKSRLRRIR